MNHIQIEIGGKLRNWKYNMAGAMEMANEFASTNSVIQIYAMVYCGLYGWAVVNKELIDFTFNDVSEWVDKMETDKRTELIQTLSIEFTKANPPASTEVESEDDSKKKEVVNISTKPELVT